MNEWKNFDLNRTIHDYDYTMRALRSMHNFTDTPEFESMDTDAIFEFISNEMSIVPFSDFLKRYIYERVKIDTPFKEVPDSVYEEIIGSAFEDNNASYSFAGTKTRKSLIIRRWLTQKSVKRETVFLLGFGLKMTADDASVFLTKVLGEEDFDFSDPQETIIWFCLKRNLPYSRYLRLMAGYGEMAPGEEPKIWASMTGSPELFLTTEKNLRTYLSMLATKKPREQKQERAFLEYTRLYDRCRAIIADIRNHDGDGTGLPVSADDITPGDAEREFCSGIPYNKSGNLEPLTRSWFSELFQNKKMSRQRITTILERKRRVERFDLITLLFFLYAEPAETEWSPERFPEYVAEVNRILHRCGMADIYPVIPYEAFILMCLLTESPLDVYTEIWERSYD